MALRILLKRNFSYTDGLALQQEILRTMRENPAAPETLLLVEHRSVITLGRQGNPQNLLLSAAELAQRGIEFHHTNRGGDITYHGAGQWTLYPLLRLANRGRDLHRYLHALETLIIHYLQGHNLCGERNVLNTGVWIGTKKIAAIGIACSAWITWHGCAINIQPNLAHFTDLTIPCGLDPKRAGVTSLAQVTGKNYDMESEAQKLIASFREIFR